MGFMRKMAAWAKVTAQYVQTAAAGTAPPAAIFVNPSNSGETYEIMSASAVYDVAGGAVAAADVKVTTSGTAFTGGTSALTSVFDLTAAARTIQSKALSTTKTRRFVKPGQSVILLTSGTLTALTGLIVQIELQPLTRRTSRI